MHFCLNLKFKHESRLKIFVEEHVDKYTKNQVQL